MIRQFTAIIQAIVPAIVAVHNDEHNIYPPRTAVVNPLKTVVPCLSQSYGSLRAATRYFQRKLKVTKGEYQITRGSFHTFPMKQDCQPSKVTSKDVQKFSIFYEAFVTFLAMERKVQLSLTKKFFHHLQ
ncbi:uncharacterized protein LOC130613095 [Hydractinia symbiolongicarpus]|nr:uncharacterized protein LOC130613095 [Hydractinia symbiolongicarpus]